MKLDARTLILGIDHEPMPEETAREKLKLLCQSVKNIDPEPPYRWTLRLELHPSAKTRMAEQIIGQVVGLLGIPAPVDVGWSDSDEDELGGA